MPESAKFWIRSLRSCWVFDDPLGYGHRRPLERNFYAKEQASKALLSSFRLEVVVASTFSIAAAAAGIRPLGLLLQQLQRNAPFFNGLSPRKIPFAPTTALALKTNMEFSKKLRKICTRHSYVVHIHKLKKVLFANEAMNSRKQVKVRQCKSVLFLF